MVITELWREAIGPYMEMLESGVDMVVGEVNVRFLGPARFDDELDLEARLTRLGETSVSTRIDGSVAGSPVVEGRLRHVFIDPPSKTKIAIPADIRAGLEPYVDDTA